MLDDVISVLLMLSVDINDLRTLDTTNDLTELILYIGKVEDDSESASTRPAEATGSSRKRNYGG
jgi:hypothetical protein